MRLALMVGLRRIARRLNDFLLKVGTFSARQRYSCFGYASLRGYWLESGGM